MLQCVRIEFSEKKWTSKNWAKNLQTAGYNGARTVSMYVGYESWVATILISKSQEYGKDTQSSTLLTNTVDF